MDISDGAPSFASLLSPGRFLHRTKMLQRQAEAFLRHPLFLEFVSLYIAPNLQHNKDVLEKWNENLDAGDAVTEKETGAGLTFAHGGSSMGNMDLILPSKYPLASNHPWASQSKAVIEPTSAKHTSAATHGSVHLLSSDLRLRCRPGEIYLGASTSNGKLHLKFFWDGNVFDDSTVKEWLDEVKGAVLWYLAGDIAVKSADPQNVFPHHAWTARSVLLALFLSSVLLSLIFYVYI